MQLFRYGKTLYEQRAGDTVVQVIQRGGNRELRFGNHIVQSAVSEKNPVQLQLQYTQAMMAGWLFAPHPQRILQLGLGAGSLARAVHSYFPNVTQTVVELLPEVIDVAYRFFQLPVSPRLQVVNSDAAAFLDGDAEKYDLIFLDAYHAEGVAEHLKTSEFFHGVRDRLRPGGWAVNNVWGSDGANLETVKNTMSRVFRQMFSLPVGAESNIIFFAAPAATVGPSREDLAARAAALSPVLEVNFAHLTRRLTRVRPKPGAAFPDVLAALVRSQFPPD